MINILFILFWIYVLWNGLLIKIGDDVEIELYAVKRFFKKKHSKEEGE